MSSQNSQSASQKIRPGIAPFARIFWIILAVLCIFHFSWLMFQYELQHHPVQPHIAAAMQEIGLAPEVYPTGIVLADLLFAASFMGMAIFIFWRRGDNPIVYCIALTMLVMPPVFTGLAYFPTGAAFEFYLVYFDSILAFIANGMILLMIYTLPDGEFAPKWSRWLYLLSIVYLIAFYASARFWPLSFDIISRMIVFLAPLFLIQFYRYRHVSSPIQRQQTKWVLLGIAVALVAFFAQGVPAQLFFADSSANAIRYHLFSLPLRNLLLSLVPLSLGIAALRYRLWDIDLTLNRSLVLGVVTIVLVILFAIDFFIAHALLTMILPANHQMIAGAIAAAINIIAFNPTRRLVRRFVDRQFYGFRFDLNELRAAQKRNQDMRIKGSYTGRELEGYRLGNIIGRGGMGEVYEGLNGAQPVAIKALPASYFHDETSRRRFEREAEATKRLSHPNIVKVLGSGICEDLAYIILEYVSGNDLRSVIEERGALPLDETLDILRGITTAVDAVHAEGIIHRDLKPSNIMLPMAADGETYHPVLMDFGLARLDNLGSTLTGSGAIGTVAYMSPEQFIESKSVDYRADIYALGIMVYEMLAGRPPFEDNPGQIMFAQIQQPAPDLRETIPAIPSQVAKAIQKAMAKDASERFKTAGEFLAAMENPQ